MLIDALAMSDSTVALVFSQPAISPVQTPLNPLSPGFTPSRPVRAPLSAPIDLSDISSPSSISHVVPSFTQTRDEIQAINAKHSAIKNKLDMLANSISSFIGSITSSSSSSNSANTANNNFNYDSFVRNPPNTLDVDNLSLQDSLFSSTYPTLSPRNSFNILSFNINGLKMFSHNKIELLNDFFSLKNISFGGVVDTHLHPKQVHFLSKRLSNYTVFSSVLDTSQHVCSSGGVSLLIENSLASHVHTYSSLSSRLLSVDLYFKGHVKLHIFVVYIPLTSDQSLRDETIDLLIRALSEAKRLGFHHAICGNFYMHLDQFYPLFFNQPQIASKRIHRLFNFLLSNGYVDFTPVNFSFTSLGTFYRADIISRIDYVWSCPLLKHFLLTSVIFDARDVNFSDHNLVITYYDYSFLSSSIKPAHARQLKRHSRHIFSFDSVTPLQWDDFSAHIDNLCNISPTVFASWHINQMCTLTLLPVPMLFYPHVLLLLRGLHLLKEKEFQDSSIKAHLESRDQNFDTDISSFISSALSRSCSRIMLDCIFIDHPTTPQLLTDPKDISDAVVNHFQTIIPIKATPPSHISALPDRWRFEYSPMNTISPDIYSSLLAPPSLEEWLSTVSSMPNGKAPGPSIITYEMLKHLGPATNSLLLLLIRKCFATADIPDLWQQAMVFPISKPHEWRYQLKNTRPITLLEVIWKSFIKLFYTRLSAILAAHNVLKGGNFAGLPGGTCRDPIITLESIIHDANHHNSPLWVLSQNISKAFDSVNLTMLKFALEHIRLPASVITFILSLFMNRSNWVFTAYGKTSSYRVRIGIDQGEVISPLLWVIYIDPLLTVLKNEMLDPYILQSPTLLPNMTDCPPDIVINNLVFMDDSTLISSSKAGLEHMLSITEEFYALNNTSANHQKYVLISNSLPLTTTSTILPVEFHLSLSSLNEVSSISVTPLSITSSFHFLGVWFNIKGSRDFVRKQIAVNVIPSPPLFARPNYLQNKWFTFTTRCSFLNWSTQKANFSRSLPNPILYLSQALGLINLFSYLIECHVNNLFLMANFSTSFIQHLFIYRLMLIQFRFLIPISPLMVADWSLWSAMTTFKNDYITCTLASMISTPFCLQHARFSSAFPALTLPGHTPLYSCMSPYVFKACLKVLRKRHFYYLSQLIAPSGSHLLSWTAYQLTYIAQLADKPHGVTTSQKNWRWLISLDAQDAPLFGKQLSVQPKKDTCVIVHWTSDCLSSPSDVIRLRPCPGCDAHVPFPSANKYTAVPPRCTFKISLLKSMILPTDCKRIRQSTKEVISPYSWADLSITVIPYFRCLNISPDLSSSSFVVEDDLPMVSPLDDLSVFPSLVFLPSGSHYRYYTDGSLVNLRTPDVSMGWSWVQLIHDAGYLNSVATYAHGTIRNWPSSTRAEAAAIYATLRVSPDDSTITIYTDSQAAIDGLSLCASSSYTNSRLYYKTTNFELWASIEHSIRVKHLTVFPVKVKSHNGNYWNEFADSLASSAHHSDSAPLLPASAYTSSHNVCLVYNNVVCESNPRRLLKLHFQATFLKDLLSLKRFQFIYCLYDMNDYVIDWELTWFALNFSPAHDASFQASHAARHYTFKFKLFLDDLPLLEKLKITRSDLYIDLLTCHSCRDRMEDLMQLILCSKRHSVMHQILQSYQNHLFFKLREAGELADKDPVPMLRRLSSLSCWTISSSNWFSYALIRDCLPAMFIDLFVELSIPRQSAIKAVAAIHNNFIQKLRKRIWIPRTYDKSKWEDAMNITLKLKTTPRPFNLPATSYVPFSSLPPLTHLVSPRDSDLDWIKNSMTQGLPGTISKQAMDEDIIADTAADVKVEGPSSPPKENNTASTSLSSPPNTAAALSAPGNNASDGLNTSMHARTRTSASSPNASPDMDTADDFPVDPLLIHTLTFSIERKDYQAAAAPNSAPETLKNFSTNKALIDAVNNAFLETYDAYTGKAKMTSFGDSKRLIIYFQTAEAHDACVGAAHQQFPDLVFHAHDLKQLRSDEDL
ncbi:hypothetical protein RclHR1_06260010 [Rhizophagus clarus]|uniref:Reverse transcriptase domain-containing protein n=1 Tax=Rhizophagus clarus TaxID=94130 RepID=A0A2Z6RS31_9GLOM|nr:hypothetical protein RclHR1_06260010 [Rhizophagus clarus]